MEKMTPLPQSPDTGAYSAKMLKRGRLSKKAFEVELARPPRFEFFPGQRIRIVDQELERDYSLISIPGDSTLAFCVRHVQTGGMASRLAGVETGTKIRFTGPHGYFSFRPSRRPAVLVATGTGIAPFVSIARSGVSGFTLLHGVRSAGELYYAHVFRRAAKNYVPCLTGSESAPETALPAFRGRVTRYLEEYLAPGVYDFYLCGRSEMIRDVTILVDERFAGSRIYSEAFF